MIDGLESAPSRLAHAATVTGITDELAQRGMALFAHIDHSAAAARMGLELGPTDLLLFGSPAAGTVLMQQQQTAGIDLPLKILVWTAGDRTWISYNRPAWVADRHHVGDPAAPVLDRMKDLFDAVVAKFAA